LFFSSFYFETFLTFLHTEDGDHDALLLESKYHVLVDGHQVLGLVVPDGRLVLVVARTGLEGLGFLFLSFIVAVVVVLTCVVEVVFSERLRTEVGGQSVGSVDGE